MTAMSREDEERTYEQDYGSESGTGAHTSLDLIPGGRNWF